MRQLLGIVCLWAEATEYVLFVYKEIVNLIYCLGEVGKNADTCDLSLSMGIWNTGCSECQVGVLRCAQLLHSVMMILVFFFSLL
jgi:hypothetical protein